MQYAYLFEARGIQRFLFATGKLKDMLNGSELVDYICAHGGYLDQVLDSLNLKPSIPRRAGGAFYLIFSNQKDAQRMQTTWRIAASQWLVGMELVDTIACAVSAKSAVENGLKQLAAQRNQVFAEIPSASPLAERSPRTGLAATSRHKGESLDAATSNIRDFKRPANSEPLTKRFLNKNNIKWPVNFEHDAHESVRFPLGDRQLVGLLHADGNGLGELLRVLSEACQHADDQTYIHLYQCFSEGVTRATVDAAREACEKVLLPQTTGSVLPARPLVLGGDDLSMVIRADLALPFTETFLTAFEQHSERAMFSLKSAFEQANLSQHTHKLPTQLTACAGVVFMKCSQPFYSAYQLSEGLCKRAKNVSRQYKSDQGLMPSTVSFFKVNDSLLEDVDAMIQQTQTATHHDQEWQFGLTSYSIRPIDGLPQLEQLYALRDSFKANLNDRPLRELATLLHVNIAHARQVYERWLDLNRRHRQNEIELFQFNLENLLNGKVEPNLPFKRQMSNLYISPITDLLTLSTIQQVSEKDATC